eukprot:scaffold2321_cov329-Prasinococcus_capsulatus_cf.AAC.11
MLPRGGAPASACIVTAPLPNLGGPAGRRPAKPGEWPVTARRDPSPSCWPAWVRNRPAAPTAAAGHARGARRPRANADARANDDRGRAAASRGFATARAPGQSRVRALDQGLRLVSGRSLRVVGYALISSRPHLFKSLGDSFESLRPTRHDPNPDLTWSARPDTP